MKWWQKPVRMMRLDYISDLARMKDEDLDALARSKKQDWHINTEWVIATPGIAPGLGHQMTFENPEFEKYAPLGNFDMIRDYVPYLRKYGINVLVYTNMHWFSFDFAARHPGWEQLLEDGTPYGRKSPLYGTGTTFCVNGPWRDWAYGVMRECMRAGIDGVFLDGPVIFPGACYCDVCRSQFRERFGADMPSWEDWANPLWKDLIDFREDSMAAFLRDGQKAVQEINPEGVIFLNAGSWHSGAWRVARAVEKVGPYQNFNGAEVFFHPGSGHEPFMWAAGAKHLEGAGQPSIVFSHHALGSWHYIPLPEAEVKISIAQTTACGSNPWLAVFDYALDHSREQAIRPYREMFGFLERNDDYFTATQSAAKVAILYSRQSTTFYLSSLNIYQDLGSGKEQDLIADLGSGEVVVDWKQRKATCDGMQGNSYIGWFNSLTREHIPFDVIHDGGVSAEGLARYSVLILPNSACLTNDQVAAIRQYVENGGSLIASFETGWYDERGYRRETNPLADLLGYESLEGLFPLRSAEEYLKVKHAGDATASFREGQLLPRPMYSMRVKPLPGRTAPVVFMNVIGALYTAPKGESAIPAVLLGQFGKGKVAFLPHLAEEAYGRLKMDDHRQLMAGLVRWADPSVCLIETNAPGSVQIELRTQDHGKRLLVHLVNNTGDMVRPITELIPIHDLSVRVKAPKPSRAFRLSDRAPVTIKSADGWVEFAVGKLTDYEVVAIELG